MMRCLLVVLACAACSDPTSSSTDGGPADLATGTFTRFVGGWTSCTFSRRLSFTTPTGTPDRAMVDIMGTLAVTNNGDGTITLTPTAAGITNCVTKYKVATSLSFGNIVPGQTCDDNGLTLSFANNSDVDVSTGELAASFVETISGTYMGQPASGNGGGVYHCTR